MTVLASCDDGADGEADSGADDRASGNTSEIEVTSTGSGKKVDLSPGVEKGTTSSTAGEMTTRFSGSQIPQTELVVAMEIDQRVTDVDGDHFTVETTYDSLEVEDAPAQTKAEMEAQFEQLEAATISMTYDQNGTLVGEPEIEGDISDQAAAGFENANMLVVVPDEPVAPGATWEVVTIAENEQVGVEVEVTTRYELVQVDGDTYRVEYTSSAPIDGEVQGAETTGDLSGKGTMTGTIGSPFASEGEVSVSTSVRVEGSGGSPADISVDAEVSVTER